MVQELINTFEELKQNSYIINIGKKGYIMLKFENEHFYHLAGLHKINIDMYFPNANITKDKKYKYIKSHSNKFENILKNKLKDNLLLQYRISTFKNIPDLLKGDNTILYNLQEKNPMSLYDGDFGLMKVYQNIDIDNFYCLLGIKNKFTDNNIFNCVPQSWMAGKRPNNLVQYKRPLYFKEITRLPNELSIDTIIEIQSNNKKS